MSFIREILYFSALLWERHPNTCKRLIALLEKHNVSFSFAAFGHVRGKAFDEYS